MRKLKLKNIPEAEPKQECNKFGNSEDENKTIAAVAMPFKCYSRDNSDAINFSVVFDVIDGDLPFLIGTPTLKKMRSNINFEHDFIGFKIGDKYHRVAVDITDQYTLLPIYSNNVASHYSIGPSHYTTPSESNQSTKIHHFQDSVLWTYQFNLGIIHLFEDLILLRCQL